MRVAVSFLVILCAMSVALAGDYRLTVANDKHAPCVRGPAAEGHPDWPVVPAKEVAEDLLRHFRGERPRLELFVPFFINARITFCGAAERREINEAFLAILQFPVIHNEWDLYDYVYMLGSRELVKLIDEERQRQPAGPTLKRLDKARAAVLRGVKARHQ